MEKACGAVDVVKCPCQKFHNAEAIRSAIDTEDFKERLVTWLRGDQIKEEGHTFLVNTGSDVQQLPCHGVGTQCTNRTSTAFLILNAIRDGCRHYLETPAGKVSSNHSTIEEQPTYEDKFPSLPSPSSLSTAPPTVLVGRSKKKQNDSCAKLQPKGMNYEQQNKWVTAAQSYADLGKKVPPRPKRRIRPAPATACSTSPWGSDTSNALNQVITTSDSNGDVSLSGNISKLPSEDLSNVQNMISSSSKLPWPHPQHFPKAAVEVTINSSSRSAKTVSTGPILRQKSTRSENSTRGALGVSGNRQIGRTGMGGSPDENGHRSVFAEKAVRHSDPKGLESGKEKNVIIDVIMSEKQIERLVVIYSTIIQQQLVPSVAMELHLLARLISVSDEAPKASGPKKTGNIFAPVFQSGHSCRNFACCVLVQIRSILLNLGHEVIKPLLVFPPLLKLLPNLVADLRSVVDTGNRELTFETDRTTMVGNTNTAILTLPFDHNRDSRHNYKTREQSALFKNREESRDAFLFQLRAFQDVRGRVLDPGQAERSFAEIRIASREMMLELVPGNVLWFSELFCDLLLQIGLVPMEETDKDILKHVADKEKLQKLHRRFTSKGGQKNKSSQKLVLDQKSKSSAPLSADQPETFFPGHQEFFLLFLQSVDSYSFGVQLCRRLVGMITKMAKNDDVKGLERRLLKLQLLSKFLGFLVFSPNWNIMSHEGPGSDGVIAASSDDAIFHLNSTHPVLPLRQYIEDGWRNKRLVATLPWVIDFLRMARWDNISKISFYYQVCFGLLRSIHRRIGQVDGGHSFFNTNMVCLSLQLETLFADVVGLGKASFLPVFVLPEHQSTCAQDQVGGKKLDMLPLWFSKTYLFSVCSHVEEFLALIVDMTHCRVKPSGGASKKMRPYAISNGSSMVSPEQHNESSTIEFPILPILSPPRARQKTKTKIQGKLVDAFFHQHRELQELCEFVVDRSVKNASLIVAHRCIASIVDDTVLSRASSSSRSHATITLESYRQILQDGEKEIEAAASVLLREESERLIRESMKVLAPPRTVSEVLDVATSLAISHSSRLCEIVVISIVKAEIKKNLENYKRNERKRECDSKTTPTYKPSPKQAEVMYDCLKKAAAVLKKCTGTVPNLSEQREIAMVQISTERKKLCSLIESVRVDLESVGDKFTVAVYEFDSCAVLFLRDCFSDRNSSEVCLSLTLDIMRITLALTKVNPSECWLSGVGGTLCQSQHVATLIQWASETHSGPRTSLDKRDLEALTQCTPNEKEISSLLVNMAESNLINVALLERSLISALHSAENVWFVANLCAHSLNPGQCNENDWSGGNRFQMLRLRKELSRVRNT